MPGVEPRLSIRAIRPLVSGLSALGYDSRSILESAGIDDAALSDPDARVPASVGGIFLRQSAELTGDTNIGLHLAERAELGSFDVHFYAMVSSSTLEAAYERVCRYQRLIHDTSQVELLIEDDRGVLRHQMPGGLPASRQTAEFIVAAWVRAGRIVTNQDWKPHEVRFAHSSPPRPRDHEQFFKAPVCFGAGENALVLPRPVLELSCAAADPALLGMLDRYATERLRRTPASATFVDRVRAELSEELHDGDPSAEGLARRLKMSVRTLNRKLAAEETSYRQLLDRLRHRLAVRLLNDRRVSVSEVAFLAGFSELSAFNRAFKRWTGLTPSAFRQQRKT